MFYGFLDMRYFFSLYQAGSSSIVIVPEYIAHSPVLRDAIGGERIIAIRKLPHLGHPEPKGRARYFHYLELFLVKVKLWLFTLLVSNKATAYFFNDFSVYLNFVLISALRRRKNQMFWIDAMPWLKTEASPMELVASRGPGFQKYLRVLSRIVGERIIEAQYRPREAKNGDAGAPCQVTAVGYTLAEPLPEKKIALLSWPEIKQKFGLRDFSPGEKAVLVIETPFDPYWPKVDAQETYARTAAYLDAALEPDAKIHFKLHYSNPDTNHFAGTIVEDRVSLLPHSVPAELYVISYDRVYFFMSSSILAPTQARLFSLSRLIEFEEEKERQRYFSTYNTIFKDHPGHIEMISDE